DKEGNEISLLDVIETEPVEVVKNYSLKQDIDYLYQLIPKILSQREQEIITLRYGLYGKEEMTQREIAKRLNISRSYVSRIEKNALLKLREHF
ncbi:sigma-70 family RNA polymerase sigma factor, partial [Pseudomonas otitidis]|nr:sigma-70 family RNA polymerase sigma factor [Pseudomonas otitidis]